MAVREDSQLSTLAFMTGGGAMGALCRAHDWASTPLGAPEAWPGALKTAVRLILNTEHPMYIWWGPDLRCFYNDAYSRSLGPEQHPRSLGQPGREVWAEIWPIIGSQIDQVMSGKGATWNENQLVPITRNGRLDDVYWTYSYSPINDETAPGGIGGVLVVCSETTDAVLAERMRAAEVERQRRLFEQAPGFIAVVAGPEHVFEFANAAYRRLTGNRDTLGRTVREAFPELEGQNFFELLDRVFAKGERFAANAAAIRLKATPEAEPTEHFLDFIYEPIRDEGETVTGIFVEGYDVTERVRAEAQLRESEARLARALDAGELGVWELDLETLAAWRSPQHDRIFGYENMLSEWTYQMALEHVVPEDRAYFDGKFQEAIAGSGRWDFECRIRRPDGEVRWIWARGKVDGGDDGQPGRMKGMVRDITERIRTEQTLRESEARFRLMADAVPQIVWITDSEGGVEFFNKQWFDYTGAPYEPTTATEVAASHLHPDDASLTIAAFEQARTTGTTYLVEHRIRSRAGDYRWFLVRGEPYRDANTDEVIRWFGASVDIHDRKLAEASLSELNATLEEQVAERTAERDRMWRTSPDLLLIIGSDGVFRRVNPAWTNILGYAEKELVGTRVDHLVHPEDVALTEKALADAALGPLPFVENRYRHKDGSYRWIAWITPPPENGLIFASGRDVTAKKKQQAELEHAQEALRQSQKMEAMGSLTGGVAHDFNNLLTPIIGSLDLLQRRNVGSEREQRLIAGAMQSADRAKTLVQRLLAFARRQPLQPIPVDVGGLVEGMADLLASTTGPQVRVVIELAKDLPPAKADPNQLEMALLNLGVNARDAMPEGGALRISATRESVRETRDDLRHGHYVRISVADTGTGMDEATLARAIEPFFSTKGIGKGTGLGLSMVHGLAAQLGGALRVQSRQGVGTNVELWLPISAMAVDVMEGPGPLISSVVARGLALLVDDEETVRASTADMLEELGYQVEEADSAEAALSLICDGLVPDLLITDHLMPGMAGVDLARTARERLPNLLVLIISGYAEAEGVAPDLPRLTKPFRSAELAASLTSLSYEQR